MNVRSRTWTAMLPAQSSSRPSGSRRLGQLGGQVGILDHLGPAVDRDDHAQLLVGREPLDHLERHLGVGLAVQAEERRVGDLDQRIVDLEVEERADAPLAHLVQAARRAVRPGRGQRGERAAVAVGAEGDVVPVGQQDLARRAVDRRHLPLDEEPDVLQAEPVVALEEGDRRLVVLGAGHDVERHDLPCRRPRATIFSAWIWNRLAGETGPIGKVPFGPSKPSRVPDPPATRMTPTSPAGQGAGPDLGRPPPGHPLAVGLRQPDHLDRPDLLRSRRPRPVSPCTSSAIRRSSCSKSIAAISRCSRGCVRRRQGRPTTLSRCPCP